ncbi:MAG TPA: VTT domain-containing protein [Burkholderiaceae bacterium]|nr:VTT domain-containing protein [Burkholderiaceae bacterium]
MRHPFASLRHALTWAELAPTMRSGLWVVALFVSAVVLVREFAVPIQQALAAHNRLGVVLFVATSVVAVLMPMATNLPLLPLAVLAWGPWWTAALLLLGWVAGAALSFWLGRHARATILRHFPSVQRHADIDRLIHPRHRLASLVMLRMTFPVDVLSYALGLFSRSTTLAENAMSTALGAAPFALVFSWFPILSATAQAVVFVGSALAFVVYALWLLRRPQPAPPQ